MEGFAFIIGFGFGILGLVFSIAVGMSIIQIPAKLDKLTEVLEKCIEDDGE